MRATCPGHIRNNNKRETSLRTKDVHVSNVQASLPVTYYTALIAMEIRNAYNILAHESIWKRPLARPRCR
jgi:hypothetical protein